MNELENFITPRSVIRRIRCFIHCTTPDLVKSILHSQKIECSNTIRKKQSAGSYSEKIQTRDTNKSGGDGVYVRFLLNDMTATRAAYGASGSRGARICLDKARCLRLEAISASLGDYCGSVTRGDLSRLNSSNAFNAEACIKENIPVSVFSDIYIKHDDRKISYGNFSEIDPFSRAIANIYLKIKNEDDYRAMRGPRPSENEIKEGNAKLVDDICNIFRRAEFNRVENADNHYYRFFRG